MLVRPLHQLWSIHQAAHVSKYLLSSWDFYRSLAFLSFSPYTMGQAVFVQFQGGDILIRVYRNGGFWGSSRARHLWPHWSLSPLTQMWWEPLVL